MVPLVIETTTFLFYSNMHLWSRETLLNNNKKILDFTIVNNLNLLLMCPQLHKVWKEL